eukprot:12083018-Ditylum_brightwellii.AAC.1
MRALTGCVGGDVELAKENSSIAVVGKDKRFTLVEGGGNDDDDNEKEGGEEEIKEEGGVEAMEI